MSRDETHHLNMGAQKKTVLGPASGETGVSTRRWESWGQLGLTCWMVQEG